ncbi:YdbC family protein [Bacillus wiedmannii]|uniref:YdbC family protein n=1 Tax=Bacillus wiedmannii TaxID=1890302 RepID=UPI003D9549C5
MGDIKFEIKENVGVLSQSPKGWTKELNFISWNGKEAKYDLRDWAPNYEKMGKGITLSVEELKTLKNVLNSVELK